MELNLFHDSANLPRLALRLRLRLSALSSRSEQPRSISAASLHFLPMLSRCWPSGEAARALGSAGCSGHSALYYAAFAWSAPSGAPRSVPPPAGCACDRDWFNWDWGCERHLRPSPLPYTPKLLSIRNPRLPMIGERGSHSPRLGLWTCSSGSFLQSPHPSRSQGPWDLGAEV